MNFIFEDDQPNEQESLFMKTTLLKENEEVWVLPVLQELENKISHNLQNYKQVNSKLKKEISILGIMRNKSQEKRKNFQELDCSAKILIEETNKFTINQHSKESESKTIKHVKHSLINERKVKDQIMSRGYPVVSKQLHLYQRNSLNSQKLPNRLQIHK